MILNPLLYSSVFVHFLPVRYSIVTSEKNICHIISQDYKHTNAKTNSINTIHVLRCRFLTLYLIYFSLSITPPLCSFWAPGLNQIPINSFCQQGSHCSYNVSRYPCISSRRQKQFFERVCVSGPLWCQSLQCNLSDAEHSV